MKKEKLEQLLNDALSTGADFAEIYEENKISKVYYYIDSKLDNISYNNRDGVGIRIVNNNEIYYGSINYENEKEVDELVNSLKSNINDKVKYSNVKLNKIEKLKANYEISYNDKSDEKIKEYMVKLDKKIRSLDKRIEQVSLNFTEKVKNVTGTEEGVEELKKLPQIVVIVDDKAKIHSFILKVFHVEIFGFTKGKLVRRILILFAPIHCFVNCDGISFDCQTVFVVRNNEDINIFWLVFVLVVVVVVRRVQINNKRRGLVNFHVVDSSVIEIRHLKIK